MTVARTEQAALAALTRGWSVIPVAAGQKRPLVRWEEFQRRCATAGEIQGWLTRWPDANLGIVTGVVSGLVVLDVDPLHGGEESLEELERTHGPLPETVEVKTGGGGRHLYYRHPGGLLHNRAGLKPGIDLRGDGGLVVAPPSRHPSGKFYEWEVSHHPDDVALAPLPSCLLALAGGLPVTGAAARAGHSLDYWRHLLREGVAEGRRNDTIASLAGHLFWHGVDPEVATEILLCWNRVRCRPPLSDDEVARTVDSIRRTHERHTGGEG